MEIALTYIYGIGRTTSKEILAATGVNPDLRSKDLTDEDLAKLREYIEESVKSRVTCARGAGGHPPQDRDRLLPGPAPPPWSARAWTAHQDQRSHP